MKLIDFKKMLNGTNRSIVSDSNDNEVTEENFFASKKYKLTCKNSHVVEQRANDVIRKIKVLNRVSQGCPECYAIELEKLSLENAKKYLPEGFNILGSYRKDVQRVGAKSVRMYKLECSEKHLFDCESGQMKSVSCPKCSEKIYVGQERTRKIFEELFSCSFKTIRPDWLKSPKTGRNLELDGYNEQINIAFEYQGNQHYNANTQFQDEYYAQAERDSIKKDICEKNKVKLIEIKQPTTYNQDKFINQVLSQIKRQINIKEYSNIDFNQKKFHFKDLTFNGLNQNVSLFASPSENVLL
jgi:hypothetical protein